MDTIRHALFTGWNFMRFLRLSFGVFFIIQAIQSHDTLVGLAGAFFLFTAVTNTGCCGAGGCAVPPQKTNSHVSEEINFDEVKND